MSRSAVVLKAFFFFLYHFCINMLFKYWAAGIDMDLHPSHNSHQMLTIKYVWGSPVQLCELYLRQVPIHHHSKGPGGPLENKGRASISSFSSHLILDIRRQSLPPGHSWPVSKKCLRRPLRSLVSCSFSQGLLQTLVVAALLCSV